MTPIVPGMSRKHVLDATPDPMKIFVADPAQGIAAQPRLRG